MAKKLSEMDSWRFGAFGSFYSDRLCRIIPLYFLTTAVLLLACQFLSTETKVLQNMSGIPSSLTFLKNMKLIWDEEDYFDKVKPSSFHLSPSVSKRRLLQRPPAAHLVPLG